MKLFSYSNGQRTGLACERAGVWLDLSEVDPTLPSDMAELLQDPAWKARIGHDADRARPLDLAGVRHLAPVRRGEKILCVGLNYLPHVSESPYPVPTYPVFFPRFASSLIAHNEPLVRPKLSSDFDYEGELAVVIGTGGRHISKEDALSHVAGYTIFNEGSVRDYQFKAPQWTMGKNFDNSGACGPWLVTADELPEGASGLHLETRVNGNVEQSARTDEMIFSVADLIAIASAVMTLKPGDMIVSGTPAGVGFGKKPPVYLKAGDLCEVSIEGLGTLRNKVEDERI